MSNAVIFPYSDAIDAVPSDETVAEWATLALNAFFGEAAGILNATYGGTTYGDIAPDELGEMQRTAVRWFRSYALNNPAVAAANEV